MLVQVLETFGYWSIPQYTATLLCDEGSKPARAEEMKSAAATADIDLKEVIVFLGCF